MVLLNIEEEVNTMIQYSKLNGIPTKIDYSKLRERIIEYFGKQCIFAAAMCLSERSVSLKLNNIRNWSQPEILNACELLDIPLTDMHVYFFTQDAQN